jgi:hypothetical protein
MKTGCFIRPLTAAACASTSISLDGRMLVSRIAQLPLARNNDERAGIDVSGAQAASLPASLARIAATTRLF